MPNYFLEDVTPIYPKNAKSPTLVYTGKDNEGIDNYSANLEPVGVKAKRKKKVSFTDAVRQYINDEILLNANNARVANLRANPGAMDKYNIAQNVLDFTNIASAGLPNRLSLSQNIGLVKDAVNGKNLVESWHGNNGIMPDKFAEEHPWLAMAGNTVLDIGVPWSIAKGYTLIKNSPYYLGNTAFNDKNAYTRGIGRGTEGLNDLARTGIVRGNPRGTEMTANSFAKAWRHNRNSFRDIMKKTGIENIENKFFSRTLTKEEFDAIKKASENYTTKKMSIKDGTIAWESVSADPLIDYSNYDDYIRVIQEDIAHVEQMPSRIASGEVKVNLEGNRPVNERFGANSDYVADGNPLAYYYSDGRNPFSKGHDYAGSNYAVKISNPEIYQPFMHESHLHPSLKFSPKLIDSNVEVYKRLPFGFVKRLDKNKLIQTK